MIGRDPIVDQMVVVDGEQFFHRFGVDEDDPFPSDTTVTLKVYDRTGETQLGAWPAVEVLPGSAVVTISADDHAPIPDGSAFRVWVQYPEGPPLCWYRGRVWRRV